MCGLLWCKRKDGHSPVKPLLSRYHEQKTRGQKGFGFVAVREGKVVGYERSTTFEEIEKKLEKYNDADEILMHHRYPTSTENLEETAHPIHVSNKLLKYDYYVIHNGVIQEPQELKVEHEKMGFEYTTEVEIISGYSTRGRKKKKKYIEVVKKQFNDSETLAIELALWNEGKKDSIDAYGSVAFIFYVVDKKTHEVVSINYGRNTNPLKVFSAHGMTVLSSESKDQGHSDVDSDKCITINYKTKEHSIRPLIIRSSSFSSTGASGRTSTQDGYRFPNYGSRNHTNHGIGYDTSTRLLPGGIADDIEDKKTTIIVDTGKSIGCDEHMLTIPDCANCMKNMVMTENVLCARTGKDITECYCKLHRKGTKESKKLRVGHIPSPYQSADDNKCCACFEKIVGARYYNESIKGWAHADCSDTPFARKEDTFTRNIKNHLKELNDDLEKLESELDECYDKSFDLESSNQAEAWFKNESKIDELKRSIELKNSQISRAEEFITGRVF